MARVSVLSNQARVVELVVTQLADRLHERGTVGKVLLIDWRGATAQQWTFEEDGATMLEVPRAPIGEADLKFRAAILEGKSLAADAIDGDFVPIGLLAVGEAQVQTCKLRLRVLKQNLVHTRYVKI